MVLRVEFPVLFHTSVATVLVALYCDCGVGSEQGITIKLGELMAAVANISHVAVLLFKNHT
jgi:hypothetical protein